MCKSLNKHFVVACPCLLYCWFLYLYYSVALFVFGLKSLTKDCKLATAKAQCALHWLHFDQMSQCLRVLSLSDILINIYSIFSLNLFVHSTYQNSEKCPYSIAQGDLLIQFVLFDQYAKNPTISSLLSYITKKASNPDI